MNNEKWSFFTNLLGDRDDRVNLIDRHYLLEDNYKKSNHLGITFDFFKSLNIDNSNKTFLDNGAESTIIKEKLLAKYTAFDIIGSNEIIQGDCHELPFDDKSFDIIFCSHTLEHVLSPIICLFEMRRVLKDNGDIIIGIPVCPHYLTSEHISVFTMAGWNHIIKSAGLEIIKEEFNENYNVGCFHCKKGKFFINRGAQIKDEKDRFKFEEIIK